ncbi:MAG: hypothetical protein JF587_18395 [Catenulisporales bacterium]|nr:hypothetical protein [Catenulisporales bacterium]
MSSVDIPIDLASRDAQAVARLLAAAAAPARPHELRGYEAARRAFERAGGTPARHSSGMPMRRLLGVKAAAVAGALTVTGVAVAAEADVLPSPIQRVAHQMLGGVGVPDRDPGSQNPPTTASGGRSTTPGTPHPSGGSDGGPTSSGAHSGPNGGPDGTSATGGGSGAVPGMPGGTSDASEPGQSTSADSDVVTLCRAYAAQQAGTEGALTGHDRQRLAALAGGENKIAEFCSQILQSAPADPQPTTPDSAPSAGGPNPSRDHKPSSTGPASPAYSANPPTNPPTSTPSGSADGNGHSHTPNPTHSTH